MRWTALLGGCALMALSACVTTPPAPPPPVQPVSLSVPKPGDLTPEVQCEASLDEFNIEFEPLKSFSTPDGCGIQGGVKMPANSLGFGRAAALTCDLAVKLAAFDYEVVQPMAVKFFGGHEVRKIIHVGTYACRPIRGHARLSEHAQGRAIDVMAFELDDKRIISVEKDWRAPGPKSDFLRAVAKEGCRFFSVVLTPDDNRDHHDHLHLDIGPRRGCRTKA